MPVPGFQDLMLPVLREYADGQQRSTRDVRDRLAPLLGLTLADVAELLPNGRQTRYANRIAWAHSYLKQAVLLESPQRGAYHITERGRGVVAAPPARLDIAYLMQFPEMVAFRVRRSDAEEAAAGGAVGRAVAEAELTPDEQIRAGYASLRSALAEQLLERVKGVSPDFFEELVVALLVKMGYGGSHEDAAKVVGRSGDGGIDGIIKEDRLGLSNIYLQAKRWDSTVGRPTIQQFAGALQGQRARKGVLLTTSNFSRDAVDYAKGLQNTIVLIDGAQLAQLMIDYGVGVSEVETVRLKRLDEDYFTEE